MGSIPLTRQDDAVMWRALLWAVLVSWPMAAMAQAENIAKGVDVGVHAATNIMDQGGVLGSVAVVVAVLSLILHAMQGWAIVTLYKNNQTLQDKRAADAIAATKEVASTSIAGTEAITKSGERLADHSARLQTLAERTLALPDAIARIELAFKDLADKVELALRRGPA